MPKNNRLIFHIDVCFSNVPSSGRKKDTDIFSNVRLSTQSIILVHEWSVVMVTESAYWHFVVVGLLCDLLYTWLASSFEMATVSKGLLFTGYAKMCRVYILDLPQVDLRYFSRVLFD